MVVVGGITRLTGSGLSMTDWRPISRHLPPMNSQAWGAEFKKYKESPEFKYKNFNMQIDDFKGIYWWEFIHRQLGKIVGLVSFLACVFVGASYTRGRSDKTKNSISYFFKGFLIASSSGKSLMLIFIMVCLQGVLGIYMVKSGLVKIPEVSHFRLAAHLLGAFSIIALCTWMVQSAKYQTKIEVANKHKVAIIVFLVLLILQILYGAFMAGLKAGKSFNTWPLMEGYFIHPKVLYLKGFFNNFLNNTNMIQFIHRTLGIILVLFSGHIFFAMGKDLSSKRQNKAKLYFVIVLLLQFILGIMTLVMKVPLTLAVLHQAGAALLLITSFNLAHSLVRA